MTYCQRCVLPDTRPNLKLGKDGICNACLSQEEKERIDWDKRKEMFQSVVQEAKSKSKGYDCLVPVSGGKDSYWQVITCLEYGLNPLTVTWKTPARTALGEKNLRQLINLGVDHVDYQISPKVEKKFMLQTLIRSGSPAIPMHLALFSIPLRIAVKFDIPLVVWGENSAFEYGSNEDAHKGFRLNEEWLRTYGVSQGTVARDWISQELTEKELTGYRAPSEQELAKKGVLAVFLGYYFPWDPLHTYRVAKERGFSARQEGPKTGYYNYADIDDHFISIHHYLKWYKFGFTRSFDNLSLEIRQGRMTRDEAIQKIKERGSEKPEKDIDKLCHFLGITRGHFFEIIESFRNKKLWKKEQGKWKIPNFLIPDWSWDEN